MRSIEDLKSIISNKRGIAKLNRFMIELPTDIPLVPFIPNQEMNVLCKTALNTVLT